MRLISSLKTSSEFQKLFKRGRYSHSPYFVLYFHSSSQIRLGVVASKKIGNAIKRNRAKRRMRALFREHIDANHGGDYVMVAKAAIIEASYEVLQDAFKQAYKRVHKVKQ